MVQMTSVPDILGGSVQKRMKKTVMEIFIVGYAI